MKKLATALLILLSIAANAQTIKHGDVVTGKTDSVYSRILGEKRKIYIYLPAGAADDQYAKAHYPVLYLLDGEGHFNSVATMIQQLSEVNGIRFARK
jgi:predicted alpha/beta superfamily hydrolase